MTKELAIKKNIVDEVLVKVKDLEAKGEIVFPPNYSPENALKSALLILQEKKDKNNKPVLEVCTKPSISRALLRMVIQGLNPEKSQCYFIAYGKQLTLQRSYFGDMALAKRANPEIKEIYAQVVYEDDEFEWEVVSGKTVITKHKTTLKSMMKRIIGAYAVAINYADEPLKTEIMDLDKIKEAWKKSQVKPVLDNGEIKKGTPHYEFMDEMCKRTVIGRLCKSIINSSDDSYLKRAIKEEEKEDVEIVEAIKEEEKKETPIEYIDIEEDAGMVVENDDEEKNKVKEEERKGLFEIENQENAGDDDVPF